MKSITPQGKVSWERVEAVHRAEVPAENIQRILIRGREVILTGGHRVFTSSVDKLEAETLLAGSLVQGIVENSACKLQVESNTQIANRQYMYDLTASNWHNFVLHRSGVVISNSPDRNYRFQPPAHEETIGQYNRVFGNIWLEDELYEYLLRSMDMIAAAPPRTGFTSVDNMYQFRPEWRTLLITGAMMFALQAVRINWISEEFSYSIGGVSLDLDKSSKYEAAQQTVADQFSNMLEKAKLTVKLIAGLKQNRYGVGVRSSFGPNVGNGVLTPGKFIGF